MACRGPMHKLRTYQQDAADAAKSWIGASVSPCLIEAATGAGKSHIIAELANWLHSISDGKRVLCLAPRRELVLQNHAKMIATGMRASIFSASAGIKSTRHPIVFATPGTVARSVSRFTAGYCAVIIDEAHTIAPTVRDIIDAMRDANPNLRVVGLTATPYKSGRGYIYRIGPDGRANGDSICRDPYFTKSVYRVEARALIDQGFLTEPKIGAINITYETGGLVLLPNGKFDQGTVDAAFVGHGRKTSSIIGDVLAQSHDRKGIVFFAATVRHAHEVMASLPPTISALITGETADRAKILKQFEEKKIKYLVNVGVLTTGWDCPHVDVIALLRRTESVGLLQQIIGRGLRISEGKTDCLLLDYAGNLDAHCPDEDLFAPIVKAGKGPGDGAPMDCHCPDCGHINEFTRHPDYLDFKHNRHGYALDVFGEVLQSEYGPIAVHYGRRCFGATAAGPKGEFVRCNYRWTGKECPHCGEKNDIAARFCYVCKAELIDPNDKLVGDFKALKKDPTRLQTDAVLNMTVKEGMSAKGNKTVRVDWVTPYRQFAVWFQPEGRHSKAQAEWAAYQNATADGAQPETISYVKDAESGFFRVLAYNRAADEMPGDTERKAA